MYRKICLCHAARHHFPDRQENGYRMPVQAVPGGGHGSLLRSPYTEHYLHETDRISSRVGLRAISKLKHAQTAPFSSEKHCGTTN
eukprot:1182929-Amorphochlora_amoeboformis.AAC.3